MEFTGKDYCDTCGGGILGTVKYHVVGGVMVIDNQRIEPDKKSKQPCKCEFRKLK